MLVGFVPEDNKGGMFIGGALLQIMYSRSLSILAKSGSLKFKCVDVFVPYKYFTAEDPSVRKSAKFL